MRRLLVPLACLLTLACSRVSPDPVSGEVKMLVLAYDSTSNGGEYKLVIGRVTTLKDLRTLSGDAAQLFAGAHIRVDYDQLAQANPQSADDISKLTTVTPGQPVDFAYFTVDGIVHPEDFDSLNMATIYYNFEKAHLYFADLNAALYDLPVQYFPEYEEGTTNAMQTLTDNAFWDPIARQFAVLPFKDIQELPFGMNVGIIGHEYTHAVFSNRFYQGQTGIPWLQQKEWSEPDRYAFATNLEGSLNEGLADFFGATISGDPAFVRKSISQIVDARRLDADQPRCFTDDLKQAVINTPHDKYDPYPLGTVLASALWKEAMNLDGDRQQALAQGVVDGMLELGTRFQDKDDQITLAYALDGLASTMPADVKPDLCGLLLDRFHLTPAVMPECQESRPPEQTCP